MLSNTSNNIELVWKMADAMRGAGFFPTGGDLYPCVYLAHFIKSSNKVYDSLTVAAEEAAEGDELIAEVLEGISDEIGFEKFKALVDKFSLEDFRTFLLVGPAAVGPVSGESATPDGIISLAKAILEVQNGDKVVDFGSGVGSFLECVATEEANADLLGIECNRLNVAVARMRAKVSASGVKYELSDMFAYYENELEVDKVDKAFSNYPWGMRAKHLEGKSEYLEKVLKGMAEYGRPTSADWVFNRLLVDSIAEDGIAVGVMTNGSAFNGADARVRKYFIENGWIKAAVSLPSGLFAPWTNIGTTLVIFSHGNTKGVRLVDASDLGTKERRGTSLTEADVQIIVDRLHEDSDMSTIASVDELAEREYTLSANRFLQKEIKLDNPISMGELITEVTRGASLRAKELDELSCSEDTGICYLNLSNIVDGSFDDELPYLKELDQKLEKYCLANGDLLLSKNGAPYKVAVAEVPDGRKILANGNLYIIKLNAEKVDPYYVAAFLNSPDGKEILARASKGSFIPNLPLSALRAIRIPLASEDAQERVAAAYRAKLDEIGILKLRLARAREQLIDLFSEEA